MDPCSSSASWKRICGTRPWFTAGKGRSNSSAWGRSALSGLASHLCMCGRLQSPSQLAGRQGLDSHPRITRVTACPVLDASPLLRTTRSVSRILSRTIISLERRSPGASSGQPGRSTGRLMPPLFGLAAGGVCLADRLPGRRCALTAPFHPYRPEGRRSDFCCTFPGVAPAGRYPAPCPALFGLSSGAFAPVIA